MSETISYLLEFLIDGTQINCDALKKDIAKVLGKHVSNVDWQVIQTTSQHFKLSIRGSLEDVDACHNQINKEFVNHYSCIRLYDEAGNKIRQQAYPILAHIEQQLRAFINRAMIEVNGFDWWNSIRPFLVEQKIRDGAEKVEERSKKVPAIHHPLELMLFDDLISIMTSSIQCWPTSNALSAGDLLEILSDCSSLEELQEKLAEKTRKVSLWDEVFARYFVDIEKWAEIKETLLRFVIPVRNKVMHHRPMQLWELRKLESTKETIDALLKRAVAELSEEERAKANQVSQDWLSALASTLGGLLRPFFEVSNNMVSFAKKQGELLSAFREQTAGNAVQQWPKCIQDQQEQVARGIYSLGLSIAQLDTSSPTYIGNTTSKKFHRLLCRYSDQILPENRIKFASRDEAMSKGYVRCQTCKP